MTEAYAAIDLGATSGRVVAGRLRRRPRWRSRRSTASPTGPCGCPTGCAGTCCTCSPRRSRALRRAGPLDGVGVDTWGVDYALLDGAAACSACRSTTATTRTDGHGRARVRPRARRPSSTRSPASRRCRSTPSSSCWPTRARPRSPPPSAIALVPDLLALLALRRAGQRVARTPRPPALLDARTRRVGARADRAPRAARRACSATLVEPGTALGPLLAHHELGDAHGLRRRQPRHRVGLRRRAGARRARGDPLERHLVAARARAARAGARRRRARGEPDQRARRRRHDAAAQERHGHVAAAGVPRARGATSVLRRAAPAAPRPSPATCRCSTPTTRRSSRRGDMPARIAAACERAGQRRRRPRRRSCAASSSRSPASTAGCSSAWRRSPAARCAAST